MAQRQRIRLAPLVLMMVVAVLLAACGSGGGDQETTAGGTEGGDTAADSGETFEWDYVLFVGLEHHYGELAQEFADDLRERTDGRLDITVRPAGELPYTADEYLGRVGDGSMQMADALATFMAGDCRVGAMPSLPMLVPDFEAFDEMWPVIEPEVTECINGAGANLAYTYLWPTQNIWGAGAVPEELSDIAGKTIRQTSPEHGAMVEALGGEAVTLTTEEVPPAIQRGVMDGLLTAALNAWSAGWYEFLEWGYILDSGIVPSYILVNQGAYDELPDDLKAAFDEAALAATERNNEATLTAEDEARTQLEAEGGVELVQASDEERAEVEDLMDGVWQEWADEAGASDLLQEVRDTLGR